LIKAQPDGPLALPHLLLFLDPKLNHTPQLFGYAKLTYCSRMDTYTTLFWLFAVLFFILSLYLLQCTKKSNAFYIQVASGFGMFATSKIGRKFLRLE
jgi:hypothetical protein